MDYPEDTRDYLSEAVQTVTALAETARRLMNIPGQRDRAREVMNMAATAIDEMEVRCQEIDVQTNAGQLVASAVADGDVIPDPDL